MNTWWIGIRQIRRNRWRSLLVATGVATASAVAVAVLLVMAGLKEDLRQTSNRLGADLMVIPRGEQTARRFNQAMLTGEPASFYMSARVADAILSVQGVEGVAAQTYAQTLTNARCCAGHFFVVGFDPRRDFTITPWLSEALPAREELGPNQALVGDRILLRPGQSVNLYGTPFTVAGVLEATGTGMDWTIYVTAAGLETMASRSATEGEQPLRLSGDTISVVFVRAGRGTDLIDLAERIERAVPEVQAILSSSVAAAARGQVGAVSIILLGTVAIIWVTASVLSGVIFSLSVRERAGEIGLLLAKGAGRNFILKMLAQESVLVAFVSALVGGLLGIIAVVLFRGFLADILNCAQVLPGLLPATLVTLCIGVLNVSGSVGAALVPVALLLRNEPYEVVKRGRP